MFKKLYELSDYPLEQQAQKYNYLMVSGLIANDCEIQCISNLPLPMDKTKYNTKETENNVEFQYLSLSKNRILRYPLNLVQVLKKLWKEGKDADFIICDCLNITLSIASVIYAKFTKKVSLGILTDLPDDLVTGNRFAKYVNNKILTCFDEYVFLTKDMNYVVNKKRKPYLVMEGLIDCEFMNDNNIKKEKEFTCLYAGGLNVRYGIKTLVDAFKLLPESIHLYLFGEGDYKDTLKSLNLKNVHYFGSAPNQKIIEMEQRVHLLINPRPSKEEFTKFSFPSKNMEYMLSGTPVLTTKLPGMPLEYYPFVYLIEEETAEGIANAILKISQNPSAKGKEAQEFVLHYKNNQAQTKRILELLEKA